MSPMSRDESGKGRGRTRAPGVATGLAADLREAAREVGTALRDVKEATSSLSGLGALIGDVVRQVTDVDTIKALADPTRLAILRALMEDDGKGSRVMSAKELAEELGEPQTKLYRHLKVLEAARLIEVAETRVVSGIVETRYRAAQTEIHFDTEDLDPDEVDDEFLELIGVGIDEYRDRFIANARLGGFPRMARSSEDSAAAPRHGGVQTVGCRVPEEKAEEFHARLLALVQEIDDQPRDPDGVPMEFLFGWYSPPSTPPKKPAKPTDKPAKKSAT
jgi:DNA-binding transcriptional ArsR family regulator